MNRIHQAAMAAAIGSLACGAAAASPQGIAGFLNPRTHIFSPLMQAIIANPGAAAATGTLKFNFKITLKSPVPSAGITCSAEADVFTAAGGSFVESASIAATISGTTATCAVEIPYSWAGATQSDSVLLNYDIAGNNGARTSAGSLGSIAVPANGATKTSSSNLVF